MPIVPVTTRAMLEQATSDSARFRASSAQRDCGAHRSDGSQDAGGVQLTGLRSAVLSVWLKPGGFPVKAAVLTLGTLMITPYFRDYDSVLLAVLIRMAVVGRDALGLSAVGKIDPAFSYGCFR